MNTLTSEQRILVCVARRDLTTEKQSELRQLVGQDLDWDYLRSTAKIHGLIPLLHKHLRAYARDLISVEMLATLRQASIANTQEVLFLISKLHQVHSLFQENGIATAVFKGT